jgi:hypothetical protein
MRFLNRAQRPVRRDRPSRQYVLVSPPQKLTVVRARPTRTTGALVDALAQIVALYPGR